MKAVQVGILVALVLCAGLLFKIYMGQQQTPAAQVPAAAPSAQPAAAAPEPAAPAPAAKVEPVSAPERRPHRPSPSRAVKNATETQVAENLPPQQPAALPAAPPVETPAPSSQPAAPQAALNPPSGTETAPPPPRVPHHVTIPAGTLLSVRLGETISSQRNQPGDTFTGTLDQPLVIDGFEIAGRGARVQGAVIDAQQAGRVKGVASIAIHLTKLHTSDGQEVAITTERFSKEGPTSHGDDAKKIGAGAAIGAAIGAIAGGGKGAAIGAGVGGAAGTGTVLGTRGKPAEFPVETRVTFKIEQPVELTERLR
jgi:hypothetical protein